MCQGHGATLRRDLKMRSLLMRWWVWAGRNEYYNGRGIFATKPSLALPRVVRIAWLGPPHGRLRSAESPIQIDTSTDRQTDKAKSTTTARVLSARSKRKNDRQKERRSSALDRFYPCPSSAPRAPS
ncbi:hypothetical protein Mp_7g11660 [Marchantia polymorpha subsp. ruderalis]|uniref:Uncharacterized protein n=2 Tax=Marchantia polymorpha TaxID=3197 RepID=A0AAF6BYI0_MARPO|nr:hypothetical protein MARPO_0003s0178 [Marchantia polymorpha]BBN17064.1 hypothetical protein Mp_7g11660 [Marchantia polymorpha subsp. ruderalis]|eukprot:PTQ49299.1 hypothetical protein MARPO_0003s0178 [Marchantia polymorpha]